MSTTQLSLLIDQFHLLVRFRQDFKTTRYKDGTYAIPSLCGTKSAPTIGREQQTTHKKYEQNMTKILR